MTLCFTNEGGKNRETLGCAEGSWNRETQEVQVVEMGQWHVHRVGEVGEGTLGVLTLDSPFGVCAALRGV